MCRTPYLLPRHQNALSHKIKTPDTTTSLSINDYVSFVYKSPFLMNTTSYPPQLTGRMARALISLRLASIKPNHFFAAFPNLTRTSSNNATILLLSQFSTHHSRYSHTSVALHTLEAKLAIDKSSIEWNV